MGPCIGTTPCSQRPSPACLKRAHAGDRSPNHPDTLPQATADSRDRWAVRPVCRHGRGVAARHLPPRKGVSALITRSGEHACSRGASAAAKARRRPRRRGLRGSGQAEEGTAIYVLRKLQSFGFNTPAKPDGGHKKTGHLDRFFQARGKRVLKRTRPARRRSRPPPRRCADRRRRCSRPRSSAGRWACAPGPWSRQSLA